LELCVFLFNLFGNKERFDLHRIVDLWFEFHRHLLFILEVNVDFLFDFGAIWSNKRISSNGALFLGLFAFWRFYCSSDSEWLSRFLWTSHLSDWQLLFNEWVQRGKRLLPPTLELTGAKQHSVVCYFLDRVLQDLFIFKSVLNWIRK
jgi:hypothetical protein